MFGVERVGRKVTMNIKELEYVAQKTNYPTGLQRYIVSRNVNGEYREFRPFPAEDVEWFFSSKIPAVAESKPSVDATYRIFAEGDKWFAEFKDGSDLHAVELPAEQVSVFLGLNKRPFRPMSVGDELPD